MSSLGWALIQYDCTCAQPLSSVWLFVTPYTVAPVSSVHVITPARILEGVALPPPGDLPDPGIEAVSPEAPALADRFFTTETLGKALQYDWCPYKKGDILSIDRNAHRENTTSTLDSCCHTSGSFLNLGERPAADLSPEPSGVRDLALGTLISPRGKISLQQQAQFVPVSEDWSKMSRIPLHLKWCWTSLWKQFCKSEFFPDEANLHLFSYSVLQILPGYSTVGLPV